MINFYCQWCGTQVQVDDEFAGRNGRCRACGKIITAPSVRHPEVPPPLKGPEALAASPRKDEFAATDIKAVRGWLLVFCVLLTLWFPIRTGLNWRNSWPFLQTEVGNTYPEIRHAYAYNTAASTIIDCYGLVIGVLLWSGKLRKRAPVQMYLKVYVFISVLATSMAFQELARSHFRPDAHAVAFGYAMSNYLFTAVWFAIWQMYWRRSKRINALFE